MLETIISRSFAGTTLRMMSSTFSMLSLLTSSRVPLGILTLMMNCPGSVRGKYARPINGTVTTRSSTTPPKIAIAVKPGRSIERMARRSYQFSMAWNFSLNLASKRVKKLS